jgi:predicted amidohydrolase YtcJ
VKLSADLATYPLFRLFVIGVAATVFLSGANRREDTTAADMVISSTHIVTDASSAPVAGSVAIRAGRIIEFKTGNSAKIPCVSPCKQINLGSSYLMPGLIDAHAHQASGGAGHFNLQVSGSSVSSIQSAVRSFSQQNPSLSIVRGRGWDASRFPPGKPTRYDLDAAESTKPVVLIDSDGHQLWTNSKAIEMAGIDENTPEPEGGTIVRDSNGKPTGVFLESATYLISKAMPKPTPAEFERNIRKGEDVGLSVGYTTVQGGGVSLETARIYADMDRRGILRQRISLWGSLEDFSESREEMMEFSRSLPADGLVSYNTLKGFVDGVISAHTAAMIEPYHDRPEIRGELRIQPERLKKLVLEANRQGFSVALHAIGDLAVRTALDAFEYSKKELGHDLHNRVEHIESIDPSDIPRFGELGVTASVQPTHMRFGSASSSYYPQRLGPQRLRYAFVWNSIAAAGGPMAFGTDYPVVPQDSMDTIYAAIHRTYGNGQPFFPEEKLSPEIALSAMTSTPARLMGRGNDLGKIAVGYLADLTALSNDPRKSDGGASHDLNIQFTLVNGKVVYENNR